MKKYILLAVILMMALSMPAQAGSMEWIENDDEMLGIKRAAVFIYGEGNNGTLVVRIEASSDVWMLYNPSKYIRGVSGKLFIKVDDKPVIIEDSVDNNGEDSWVIENISRDRETWMLLSFVNAEAIKAQIRTDSLQGPIDTFKLGQEFVVVMREAMEYVK